MRVKATHDAEDKCCSNGIGDNADHCDGDRAKKGEKHQHDGQHHYSERQDLGLKQALQDIVIHHQNTGNADVLVRQAKGVFNAKLYSLQQLIAIQIRRRFDHPDIESGLVVSDRDKGSQDRILERLGNPVVQDCPEKPNYCLDSIEFFRQLHNGSKRTHHSSLRIGIKIFMDGFNLFHFRGSKPIGIIIVAVGKSIIKTGVESVIEWRAAIWQVDNNIEGEGEYRWPDGRVYNG